LTDRLSIQGAKDAPAARPNKRPRLDPPLIDQPLSDKIPTETKVATSKKNNARFEQFSEVMQPRSGRGPSWANDPLHSNSKAKRPVTVDTQPSVDDASLVEDGVPGSEGISDLEWMRQRMSKALELGGHSEEKGPHQIGSESVDDDHSRVCSSRCTVAPT
jgi:multiple RNA-binding domain-containing protein 1